MEKRYIVFGRTGEYEDYRDWMVKAFKTIEAAEDFCTKCTQEMLSVYRNERDWKKYTHPLDPFFEIDCSTGTKYVVGSVAYDDI
jgi:hypothetical protein